MPYLSLSTQECPELQGTGIEDTVKLGVVGRVTAIREVQDGVNTYYQYELDVAVTDYEKEKVTLSEALDRAGKKYPTEVRPYIG